MSISRKLLGASIALVFSLGSGAGAQTKVITEGDAFQYFKGTEEPPVDWNTLAFNDAAWLSGPSPFAYGDIATGTQLTDMIMNTTQAGYLSVYIRRKFTIPNVDDVSVLNLRMRYDDGYVAYINGVEVLRKSIVGNPPAFNAPGTDHETNAYEDTALCITDLTMLTSGENVLAIQGHNVSLTSSDFTLVPELVVLNSLCPTNMTCVPNTLQPMNVLVRWTKPTATFTFATLQLLRDGSPVTGTIVLGATSFTDRNVPTGQHTYQLVTTSACEGDCSTAPTCTVTVVGAGEQFRRGDTDGNGSIVVTDAVVILNALFQGATFPACPDTADTDDNASVSITDAVFLLNALFQGGPQPPLPGIDTCGADPTADDLGPCTYTC